MAWAMFGLRGVADAALNALSTYVQHGGLFGHG
jgi:hypothetical protein